MKIGIISFHWATNYGAILQCYALQETLKMLGHEVYVINYKPRKYDINAWSFFRMKKFLNLKKFCSDLKKERLLVRFRCNNLNQSERYYSIQQLKEHCNDYDVIISGSDQVLNETFLRGGEKGGSTAYFMDFGKKEAKRICYAVSFGTTKYPLDLVPIATSLVKNFSAISCRENTGLEIFKDFGYFNGCVVPDPTLIADRRLFKNLIIRQSEMVKKVFVYLLHGRYRALKDKFPLDAIISDSESMEEWITNIYNASLVITNSFHGTVFCIHFHVPFYVILPSLDNSGMNDRFFTMLGKLDLLDRIKLENNFELANNDKIDWNKVEECLEDYKQIGLSFLKNSINN